MLVGDDSGKVGFQHVFGVERMGMSGGLALSRQEGEAVQIRSYD